MTGDALRVEFTGSPARFLDRAEHVLRADPLLSTIMASVTGRALADDAAGLRRDPSVPRWWAFVLDADGTVVGTAMRTAPCHPYPLYLMDQPEESALALARALHTRGEVVDAVNGALPAARTCAEELARLTGRRVETTVTVRLHELGELRVPPAVKGEVRPAAPEHVGLLRAWFAAFHAEADEQAGRRPGVLSGEPSGEAPEEAELLRRVAAGELWLHVDGDGTPVHLTAFRPPSYGVARIGPVYTPPAASGRGYAGVTVAAVARHLRDGGARICLNTDLANPASNALYARLGFEPVVDQANHVLLGPVPVPG